MQLFNTVDAVFSNIKFSHLNYYRLYHLLGEYRWDVVLLAKLAKDKQKLDSLFKRG